MENFEPNPQGIDYAGSFSAVNRDKDTGIRYGVISAHELTEWFWDEVEQDYGKATCPKCGNPAVDACDAAGEYEQLYSHGCEDYVCDGCEVILDSGDCFPDEPLGWSIDDGKYKAINCLDSDAMVIKSPYFTYAHFCSPCVPGACSMDSPIDAADVTAGTAKCYCFGHEWFDSDKAPYPVYSVETGKEVHS